MTSQYDTFGTIFYIEDEHFLETIFSATLVNSFAMLHRVVNSQAYGVIFTYSTCYSCTHAIDKIIHALLKNQK